MDVLKKTRKVTLSGPSCKKVEIGGDAPVSIQTMWKDPLKEENLSSISSKIEDLQALGCDIVRFAVPDMESADLLIKLAADSPLPLVADIHFDHKLALRCLDGGIAKIRINPGNIGSLDKVKAVVEKASDKGVPIRIGVNSGSIPRDILASVENGNLSRAQALVETAAREVAVFDEIGFNDLVVSMKASSVEETVSCNRIFASRFNIPLHIGVTEAGPLIGGIVKSTIALNALLSEGIGSTVRVSLSDSPENEVVTAREILTESGKRRPGVRIVSCPRCGRLGFDVHGFVRRWQNRLYSMDKDITVAVMGCVVNGPGEGKHADIGITGAGNSVIIFRQGETVRKLEIENGDFTAVDKAFGEELELL